MLHAGVLQARGRGGDLDGVGLDPAAVSFEGRRRDSDLLPGDRVQGLVGAWLIAFDHEHDVAAAGQRPLVQVHQGVQGVHGQAHPGQVHPVDDRADDGRLVRFAVLDATLGGVEPGTVLREPQVLGRFLAVELGAAAGFAVGAQAAQGGDVAGVAVGRGGQRRVRGGDRDVAVGGAWPGAWRVRRRRPAPRRRSRPRRLSAHAWRPCGPAW